MGYLNISGVGFSHNVHIVGWLVESCIVSLAAYMCLEEREREIERKEGRKGRLKG